MPDSNRLAKITWRMSIGAVVLYCLVSFFYWNLMDLLTPFVAPLLWLPVLGSAFAAIVAAINLLIQRWKSGMMASMLPMTFLIACFVITRFVDFTELWLAANFRFHHAQREQVIRRITSGELRPNVSYNDALITLPKNFASASLGGSEVVLQRDGDNLKILFFTFRGVLDSFAGFVYTADGSAPKNGDFAGRFFINQKVQDRWYYVSAH